MKKVKEEPILIWREPPQATALRPGFGHGFQPLFIEDEWGKRLNWPALLAVLVFIIVEFKPWEWGHIRFGKIPIVIIVIGAILIIILFRRGGLELPDWLSRDWWTTRLQGKMTGQSAVISITRGGLRIDRVTLPWRRIAAYRLCSHPDIEGLRGMEMRLKPPLLGRSVIFIGCDLTVDENELRRALYDQHPLGCSENVGVV